MHSPERCYNAKDRQGRHQSFGTHRSFDTLDSIPKQHLWVQLGVVSTQYLEDSSKGLMVALTDTKRVMRLNSGGLKLDIKRRCHRILTLGHDSALLVQPHAVRVTDVHRGPPFNKSIPNVTH